jgi:hypothetical protein
MPTYELGERCSGPSALALPGQVKSSGVVFRG